MPKYILAGRTVVITGSTGGLGSALATALRARGANLALLDLDADAVAAQANRLGPESVARGWQVDVRSLDSLQSAIDAAAAHFGRVDVVIANAGIAPPAIPLWDLEGNDFERAIDINLNGVWRTFRAGVPHVQKTKGYLLAIASMAAFVHGPLNGPYCAAKAGVWALADSTRLELRDSGVGVGTAHPTFFPTPMMEHVHADPAASAVWGGNERGLWKMVPLEVVVDAIIDGMEKRSDLIVAPKSLALTARIPGIVRPFVDRIGFPGTTIRDAIALAASRVQE
ncbi:SDR family NAD(P)-dependent oxidoreductase [Mycobacterium sp. NPDC051198]